MESIMHEVTGGKRKQRAAVKIIVNENKVLYYRESFPDSRYCGMCYRKTATAFPDMNTEQRKNMVELKCIPYDLDAGGKPKLGCLNCGERVCKKCWPKYDHEPTQSQKRLCS